MATPVVGANLVPPTLEPPAEEKLDIEHAVVTDDPRKWSPARKVRNMFLKNISCTTDAMF